jgi:hypothetical protein
MTWTVTLDSGDRDVVLPNGLRYQGSAEVVLSDDWYAQMSASALAALASAAELGGEASYTVTVASGLDGVVLPDGLRHKAGDVVELADEQYSVLTTGAVSTLLSSVVVTVD